MYINIIILSIIQGIAEFLPISSSAHLIIFRDIIGIGKNIINQDMSFTFDIALHFGTLLAILVYFFKDFFNMFLSLFKRQDKYNCDRRVFIYIVAATIPAALAGIVLEEKIENVIRNNYVVIALALIIMGIIIYIADKYSKENRFLKDMSLSDALTIGCSQVFALVPGFSRSGTTMAMARFLNINREDAAKFSFYLSTPIICGAVLLTLLKSNTISLISSNLNVFLIGIFVSFISGILCIKYLLKYIKKHGFQIFMIYRVIIGLGVLIYVILK